jgi:PAS domain S-box-containing protein
MSALISIAFGLAAATTATALKGLLGLFVPDITPYALVFPAVLLATLAKGAGAGAVAAAAGFAADEYFFVGKPFSFDIEGPEHGVKVGTSTFSSLLMLWVAVRYRKMVLGRGREREALIRTQLQLYQRSHSLMFVLAGPELRHVFANPTYLSLIGQQHVVGKRLADVLPDLKPEHHDKLAWVRRTGEVFIGRGMRHLLYKNGLRRTLYTDVVAQPLFAENGLVEAVFVEGHDVTEKVEAEERLKLVVQEVDHRANNLLAVIQSIATLSKGVNSEELRRNILGRIEALARAHQLLSQSRWRGAELQRLIEVELRPYVLGDPERVRLHGSDLELNPAEAQALAMGIHELATNAAKYGALSTRAGRVEVAWDRASDGGRHIRWQEDGGPTVTPPTSKGLGIKVLERALQGAVGGRTRLLWRAEGLVCEFDLPPEQSPDQPAPPSPARPEAPQF